MKVHGVEDSQYAQAMGRLLVLYTQIDQFIMEVCAERIATAPNQPAKLGLAKQVGDECRHVGIQQRWMGQFGVDPQPVIDKAALAELQEHFRRLDWLDFLTDLYLVIEALGSQAVEQIVPLADPGTRESLQVPLQDELDHVAFGIEQLRAALAELDSAGRETRLRRIPDRIQALVERLQALELPVVAWFEQVGTEYEELCAALDERKAELLTRLAA